MSSLERTTSVIPLWLDNNLYAVPSLRKEKRRPYGGGLTNSLAPSDISEAAPDKAGRRALIDFYGRPRDGKAVRGAVAVK